MSDLLRCTMGMFAAIAPFGALAAVLLHRADDEAVRLGMPRLAAMASAVAFAVLAAAALLAGTFLDWLDVSPGSFQFAAGAAMTPLAMRLIIAGDSMYLPDRLPRLAWLVPLGVPLFAGPVAIIAAISYSTRFSEADAIGSAAAVLVLTTALVAAAPFLRRAPIIYATTLARLSGALVLALAVELAYDGVHSV